MNDYTTIYFTLNFLLFFKKKF